MSHRYSDLLDLAMIDSQLGIISASTSVLDIIQDDDLSVSMQDLVCSSRKIMALQEAFCEKNNQKEIKSQICNMSNPEDIFFEGVSPQKEGRGQTERALSELESEGFLIKTPINSKSPPKCHKVEKRSNDTKIFENHIKSIINNFNHNVKPIAISGVYPTDDKQKENLKKRIKNTQEFFNILDNIPKLARLLDGNLEENKIGSYENNINFPLAGVINYPGYDKHQQTVYLLSSYDYFGDKLPNSDNNSSDKDIKEILNAFQNGISHFTDTVFRERKDIQNILCDFFGKESGRCYVRTMIVMPIWNKDQAIKKIFSIHLISEKRDIIYGDWNNLPTEKIIHYVSGKGFLPGTSTGRNITRIDFGCDKS